MNTKYLVVIEKGAQNYSAFAPDVLGCVTTGKTFEETLANMKDALEFHFESLIEDGEDIPAPQSLSYHLAQGSEISLDDIVAHVSLEVPAMALA